MWNARYLLTVSDRSLLCPFLLTGALGCGGGQEQAAQALSGLVRG